MRATRRARDAMTPNPVCCPPEATLDEVAQLMVYSDRREILVVDVADRLIGIVTDRDILRRVVAEGRNPMGYPVQTCMSEPVVTVRMDAPLREVVATMNQHSVKRMPVVDDRDSCIGIISHADV